MTKQKGSLIVRYSGNDWGQDLLSSFLLTLPKAPHTFREKEIQYHQADINNSSCVFHAGITVLSNLWGVELSLDQRKELIDGAIRSGVLTSKGAKLFEGVDYIRRRWNLRSPDKETNSLRFDTRSEKANILFNLGYMSHTGRRVFGEYTNDLRDDGVLNSVDEVPERAGYHSTTLHKENKSMYVVNTYSKWTTQPNIYRVEDLDSKVESGMFISNSYFWLPKRVLEDYFKYFKKEHVK